MSSPDDGSQSAEDIEMPAKLPEPAFQNVEDVEAPIEENEINENIRIPPLKTQPILSDTDATLGPISVPTLLPANASPLAASCLGPTDPRRPRESTLKPLSVPSMTSLPRPSPLPLPPPLPVPQAPPPQPPEPPAIKRKVMDESR